MNSSLRKLCLVIPSLQLGGMERVMTELSHYFCAKENLEVHLVLYGINPELFHKIPINLIIHMPKWRFISSLRFFSTIGRLYYLRNTIKKIAPNSILSFGEKWNSFVLLSLTGLRYHIFISDRCSPHKKLGFIHDNLRRFLYPHSSGIIVQTTKAKMIYERIFKHVPISVIGNPIRQIGVDNKQPKENIILTIGRIIPSKNHRQLVELFSKINNDNWKLVIVGGNALKLNLLEDLKGLIRDLDAEYRIELTGAIEDVDVYYHRSKIFIFASDSEGFPNVVGEAMSAGMPVVAFDCVAGPSEMISDGEDGFLVPVHDYILFEKRLIELMNDTQLQRKIGRAALSSIKKYNINKIGDKYYSLLRLEIEDITT